MNVGLIFGIIFAAIVIILLLFFGFKYINEVMVLGCESQLGQQITNLKKAVGSTLALSEGASQELRMLIPRCVERVCFVDPKHPEFKGEGWVPNEFTTKLVSRYGYNVVVIKSNGGVDGYKIDKLKPYVNFCLTSSDDVIIRNAGALVEIMPPEF